MTIFSTISKSAGAVVLAVSLLSPTLSVHAQSGGLASLFGQTQKTKFLPVHQAFNVKASQDGDVLTVAFTVTPEHYVYQDKLSLTLPDGVAMGEWQFNKPSTMIDDPEFGRVAVFEEDVVATVKLTSQKDITDTVSIKWQGCAKAGLCYPPETVKTAINLKATSLKSKIIPATEPMQAPTSAVQLPPETPNVTANATNATPVNPAIVSVVKPEDKQAQPASTTPLDESQAPSLAQETLPQTADMMAQPPFGIETATMQGMDNAQTTEPSLAVQNPTPSTVNVQPQTNAINHTPTNTHTDPFGINKQPLLAVGLLFLLGLLLAFTPCVYPMIPIVVSIVARQKGISPAKGFMLSASYGVGVATAYGILGMIIAWFGRAIGITGWLQNPYVLGVFALLFAVLALAMFDIFQIRLPSRLSNALHQKSQLADSRLGSVGGSFLVGALSALVVSPCVSLPMAGALSAISTSGSVVLGFVALFALGLGLSLPLMLMGAVQGKFMPQAGNWMSHVKAFCGLLLLAVSLSLVERIFVSPAVLALWAVWFSLVAVWLWKIARLPAQALAITSGIWAICLMIGVATGHDDAWRPLAKLTQTTSHTSGQKPDITITTLAELDKILASQNKVLVDVTAQWCVECRIMERTLFTNRPSALADYQVVKLDITDTTPDSKAVLERYGLFGPPALLIYRQGQLQEVLLGEVKRGDFETALAKF